MNTMMLKATIFSVAAIISQQSMANILLVRSEHSKTPLIEPVQQEKQSPSNTVATNQNLNQTTTHKPITYAQAPLPSYGKQSIATITIGPPSSRVSIGQKIPTPMLTTRPFRLNKNLPYEACFYSSSKKYGVPVDLLFAIAETESSFRHGVTGGLGHGKDHGLMQINDYWVPKLRKRFNISLSDIYDPCTNIEIASWILAHNFVQFGYSWRAVGAYNAVTEWKRVVYINKVTNNLQRLYAGKI